MINSIQGKYEIIKGKIKEAWGNLTDDEVALYEGKQDQFYGKLLEKHGITRTEAEERCKKFEEESATASCSDIDTKCNDAA